MNEIDFTCCKTITTKSNYYRVIESLGHGGNSKAFLVLCTSGENSGILFVFKIFINISKKGRKDKFIKEIELLNKSGHPAIVKIYDHGKYEISNVEYPFTITEYYPTTLADVMRNNLTTIDRIGYICNILSALKYLDKQSIIHRDIKPQNILIKSKNAILSDFGMMKIYSDSSHSEVDELAEIKSSIEPGASFYYRTPDIVKYLNKESELTTKSDIFQLGLVAAQLFTGVNPCEKSDIVNAEVKIREIPIIKGVFGIRIKKNIDSMLEFNPESRISHTDILDKWNRLYQDISKKLYEQIGRTY